jgi:hypothetical protein
MGEAIEAVRPRMTGGQRYNQRRNPAAAFLLAPPPIEGVLGVPPQQVKAKISAVIL